MVIYLQNRKGITKMPKEVWVKQYGTKGVIVCTGRANPYIGEYESEERANEVLAEMFKYCQNGENSYVMPKE